MRTFSAEEEDVDGAASLRRLWRRRTRRSLPDEEEEPVESVPEEELADGAMARGSRRRRRRRGKRVFDEKSPFLPRGKGKGKRKKCEERLDCPGRRGRTVAPEAGPLNQTESVDVKRACT